MAWCDFHEQRGWANNYCLKKDDYIDSTTANNYCKYGGNGCPIKESSSGSGGCYLTTACVEHMGLPDDCMELTTLRSFRDQYLANTENGEEEINDYYKTAPKIVSTINSSPNAKTVYQEMYAEVIVPCVELIKENKNEEAHEKYKAMVNSLKNKYC